MADLLFEIGTEELPSWYVDSGRVALAELLEARLAQAELGHGDVRSYGTPRRLAVIVESLAPASAAREELRRGPAAAAAFDASGSPTRAAQGFASANGVKPEALEVLDTPKGRYVHARVALGGQSAAELLPGLLAGLVADLPAPRKMRWASVATPFIRPVQWLLALLDEVALPVEAAGVRSGAQSHGHRFLAPGPVTVARPSEYLDALRAAWVLADPQERDAATRRAVGEAANAHGVAADLGSELEAEVRNLVEYPFAILGTFEEGYLRLPEEVLRTVMIHHQRFFPTRAPDGAAGGRLAAAFVGVSNNRVSDPTVVRDGYQNVLEGRLYDARFFWDADRRKSLAQHAWGLSGIGYQKDLGSMADKLERVAGVARNVADALELTATERDTLERALPVFHADLATEMVFELPELAGIMGRAYAEAEGLPGEVAVALEDGVLPRGPDDRLPVSRVGAVLSVADRLEKVAGFFAIGKRPSGSADPFALRRDGLGLVRVLNANGWRLNLSGLVVAALAEHRRWGLEVGDEVAGSVTGFLWDRVASLLGEQGIGVPVVRAALRGADSVIEASRSAYLLSALMARHELEPLLALYKRAANLASKAEGSGAAGQEERTQAVVGEVDPGRFEDPHEAPLHAALAPAEAGVEALLSAAKRTLVPWDLGAAPEAALPDLDDAIAKVLELRAPLDAFLDNVLVMVDEPALRANRLALLAAVVGVLEELGALGELEGG